MIEAIGVSLNLAAQPALQPTGLSSVRFCADAVKLTADYSAFSSLNYSGFRPQIGCRCMTHCASH